MNIYTNDSYNAEQLARAKRLRTYGIMAVVASFAMSILASYNVLFIYLAYPLLLVGFPMWTYGRSLHRRLTQMPQAEKVLDAELKGFSNKYTLYHYANVGGQTVKHLLVMPLGVLVMESSDTAGKTTCSGKGGQDRWQNRSGWLDRLSGMNPSVGNPTRELTGSVENVRDLLAQVGKPSVPLMGLVVFTRNPEVEVDDCTFEALPVNELKDTVRGIQYELGGDRTEGADLSRILTNEDRRKLHLLLAPSFPQAQAPSKPATPRKRVADKV
jgi:hypothetical protein